MDERTALGKLCGRPGLTCETGQEDLPHATATKVPRDKHVMRRVLNWRPGHGPGRPQLSR